LCEKQKHIRKKNAEMQIDHHGTISITCVQNRKKFFSYKNESRNLSDDNYTGNENGQITKNTKFF